MSGWGVMLKKYRKLEPKPKATDELKIAVQSTWEVLSQKHILTVATFSKCLTTYVVVAAGDGHCHFEHLL